MLLVRARKAELECSLRERIGFLYRALLLVVDEIGYLPVTPGDDNLSFELAKARFEKGAMIQPQPRWMGRHFASLVAATALLDACCTTPPSSRSKTQATGCASTRRCCPSSQPAANLGSSNAHNQGNSVPVDTRVASRNHVIDASSMLLSSRTVGYEAT